MSRRDGAAIVRYKIEYLTEPAREDTVCFSAFAADLDLAIRTARAAANGLRVSHGANGFQIRDLNEGGRIVALESFNA